MSYYYLKVIDPLGAAESCSDLRSELPLAEMDPWARKSLFQAADAVTIRSFVGESC